jgi:lipopolysaccharide/colanic/teichoic acid biosynthesis glycosyltransferase
MHIYKKRQLGSCVDVGYSCGLRSPSVAKRALDLTVCLVLCLPVILLCFLVALAILAMEGESPLFWQRRVGKGGQEFWFPKFRSMIPGADKMLGEVKPFNKHRGDITFKMENDHRLTKIGRFLRKWSLDECPQLWCVLKGEMSLVGPRPALPEEVERYSERERGRLGVQPGLTCTWQVSGRSELPFSTQMSMDLDYIDNQSFLLDLKLLALTIPAVISTRGAY